MTTVSKVAPTHKDYTLLCHIHQIRTHVSENLCSPCACKSTPTQIPKNATPFCFFSSLENLQDQHDGHAPFNHWDLTTHSRSSLFSCSLRVTSAYIIECWLCFYVLDICVETAQRRKVKLSTVLYPNAF